MRRFFHESSRFLLTFVFIFAIFFVILNFTAFKSLFFYYVLGDKSAAEMHQLVEKEQKAELLAPEGAKKLVKKDYPPLNIVVSPLDFRLIIPKIDQNVPIVKMSDEYISDDLWGKFEKEVQAALRTGIVHYPGTAMPGQKGNAFFTGHSSYYPWDKGNYKEVFANLNKLEIGDEYYIYYQQKQYRYKIMEKKEVRPAEVGVLEQHQTKKLSTLMTCWPLGTTLKRLILVAEQVS
ncbi:MAG TPA: sortase [Candidatus Gracilibacteria bacterium]|nr:sortase [Candidatus Gracilibacteria bacterium]